MNTIKTTEITITKQRKLSGSETMQWNVDKNGKPFGAILKFDDATNYLVGLATGEYVGTFNTYDEAETAMRGAM